MIVFPAIDLMSGRPVRLYKGDYDRKEIVASSAVETALSFEKAGAEWIHVVDLDGAKSGTKLNAALITKIASEVSIPIEVGGGIRTFDDVAYYLKHGVKRVILGTAAIEDEELLQLCIKEYRNRIAVGIDCKDGYVCGNGWLEKSRLYYLNFAKHLEKIGVQTIIFTDISKDGTLNGPNLEMLDHLRNTVEMNITASGGIRDLENIRSLASRHLYGAITGKAVYAGTLDLKQAIEAGKE
jgi:phosphoribosylformimino-5-aminoimidazole carboxamide ribotide isomerase